MAANYYSILEIEKTATLVEIKKAYRRLSRRYHPDIAGGGADTEAHFKEINRAYEELCDPEKRRKHDLTLNSPRRPQSEAPRANSKSRSTTADETSKQSASPKTKGADFYSTEAIYLTLKDAALGCEKVHIFHGPAPDRTKLRFTAVFKPSINPGPKKVLNAGFPSPNGGDAGTAFVPVKLIEDPKYRLEGNNIHVNLRISSVEATLGAGIKFLDFLDKPINVTIPRGIKDGKVITFKGRGVPAIATPSGRSPGDLKVHIRISRPSKITAKAKVLIKELNFELFGKDIRGGN